MSEAARKLACSIQEGHTDGPGPTSQSTPCPVPHLPPSSATGCRSKLSLLHSSRYSTAKEPGLPFPFSSTFDSRELQQQKWGRRVWGMIGYFK